MRFIQSLGDFPLTVALGERAPVWGLSRWEGNSGLRFVSSDDEGFTLRGDRRRLVYRGRRRSHRFTILSDGAFEYDVILEREPESNVVVLPMEGAEKFDFLRQPDFIKDPLLAGSYAVYKKETLLGEGTGKLCHINRPEIIDAGGRRCRGDLSAVGNCLYITIPEQWLSEAKYPVVVDPTIGTTTVGSQYLWQQAPPPELMDPLMFEIRIPVNRFLVSKTINGLCTAYFYTNDDDWTAGGRPVLYSDNANSPLYRKSRNEQKADFRVTGTKPAGWRSASFSSNGSIAGGTYIWFGCYTEYYWFPRFDYGVKSYAGEYVDEEGIPNTYPHEGENYFDNFKLSMYFTYVSAQNYIRRITQGVKLSDNRKLVVNYDRNVKQTVKADSAVKRLETFYRKCLMTACSAMSVKRFPVFSRKTTEQVMTNGGLQRLGTFCRNCLITAHTVHTAKRYPAFIRKPTEQVKANGCLQRFETFYRNCVMTAHAAFTIGRFPVFLRKTAECVKANTVNSVTRSLVRNCSEILAARFGLGRIQDFTRKIAESAEASDGLIYPVIFVRAVTDETVTYEIARHSAEYIRKLEVNAGNEGETAHEAEYYRLNTETIQAEGVLFRGLIMLVRLFSSVVLRDYILRRFLKARDELKLKSCVSREITLDSKII